MTTEEYIIVIELGSSKVTGIGGKKLPDGSIQIEAVVQEPSSSFIRKGIIFNLDKSAQCIRGIVDQLGEQLKRHVTQVYVGYGGQSVHSKMNSVTRRMPDVVAVTKTMIEELLSENADKAKNSDKDILDVIPLEYMVGTQMQTDPVGVLADNIEGKFLNILAKSSLRTNIQNCFKKVGILVVESMLHPLTMANEVLTETQKRSGCVLVDLGADTTTVSIYKNNLLRFISTIPLGSSNITKDIMSYNLDENMAEDLKLTYGTVCEELSEEEENVSIFTLPNGSPITKGDLNNVVTGRMTEILSNVKWQIEESGIDKGSLMGGIWIVGGGAKLQNLQKAVAEIVGIKDVHIAKKFRTNVRFTKNLGKYGDGRLIEAISIMAECNQTCTGEMTADIANQDIFAEPVQKTVEIPETPEQTTSQTLEKPEKPEKTQKEKNKFMKNFLKKFKEVSTMIVGDE